MFTSALQAVFIHKEIISVIKISKIKIILM